MSNPNPFVPKGSLLEQQSHRRSRLKLAVFCVLAVSVTGLVAMLIHLGNEDRGRELRGHRDSYLRFTERLKGVRFGQRSVFSNQLNYEHRHARC